MKTCEHGVPYYQGCHDCAEAELTAAVAAERERCAQVAEEYVSGKLTPANHPIDRATWTTAKNIAKAIRGQS